MLTLTDTTGYPHADQAALAVLAEYERALPQRVCACYVEGSYAQGSPVATSDLDLVLVLDAPLATAAERQAADDALAACRGASALELDVGVTDLARLRQSADPAFMLGARLLAGRDVRAQIELMPIERWARQRMHAAFWLTIHIFRRPLPVSVPLSYPDPADRYFGYAARPMRLPDGSVIHTTRDLVRVTGWIATARIAHQARQYVVHKRACVASYRQHIGGEWASLLERIDRRCRQDWQYRVPDSQPEQAELRAIAGQVPGFENQFVALYRRFVLEELGSPDAAARSEAIDALARTPFAEPLDAAR